MEISKCEQTLPVWTLVRSSECGTWIFLSNFQQDISHSCKKPSCWPGLARALLCTWQSVGSYSYFSTIFKIKKKINFFLLKKETKKEKSFLSRKNTPMNCQLKPSYYSPVLHFFQVVLSACSSYFQKLLIENPCKHPTIIMPQDVCFTDLRFIIEFVYRGEIDVSQSELQSLLRTADQLKIKGMFYWATIATTV